MCENYVKDLKDVEVKENEMNLSAGSVVHMHFRRSWSFLDHLFAVIDALELQPSVAQ